MNTINIHFQQKKFPVSPHLYGCFFEDINRAGDGGIYGELLRNRAFEDSLIPDGCELGNGCFVTAEGFSLPFSSEDTVPGWTATTGTEIELLPEAAMNENRKCGLKVKFATEGALCNGGFYGINTVKGEGYAGVIFAKTMNASEELALTISLGKASSKICVSGTNYKEYSFTLNSSETMQAQTFSITSAQEGTVCLGFTSLFPEDTFCKRTNGLRKDLAERVQALNPAFLRYPGGCIVEGMNRESIMHFHHTIGPIWERPSQYLLWGYRSTNGFGFDEFMQFCEDLNAVGLYVINAGMSCQGRNPHYAEPAFVKKLAQETLDMLEYALGGTETTWGKLRAQNGHSHQYPLKYLEIGNENFGKAYQKNYETIYQIIKPVIEKYYPGVEIIANEHREKCTLPCDIIDEHYYSNREFFAMNADYYDNYPRNQQVYIGEYAVTRETTRGDLVSACGEAAFLIGAERNQDVVKMTSYAPMFANEGHINWQPDLIRFSSGRNTVIPFYYVLEAFGQNRGENVIGCDITTEYAEIERSNKITLEGISADVRINDVVQKAESNGEYCGSDKDEYRIHILISEVNEHGRIGFCANNHFNQDLDGYFLHYDEGHVQLIYWNGYSRMLLSEAIKCKLTANMNIQIDIRRDKFIVKLCGENLFCYNFKKMPKIVASATATQNEIMIKCVNTQSDEQAIKLNFDTEIQEAVQCGYLTEYGFIWRTIKIENNFIYKMKPYEIAMIRASKK